MDKIGTIEKSFSKLSLIKIFHAITDKNHEKKELIYETTISGKSILIFCYNSKRNKRKELKFSLNSKVSNIIKRDPIFKFILLFLNYLMAFEFFKLFKVFIVDTIFLGIKAWKYEIRFPKSYSFKDKKKLYKLF